ncbi:hypothetical protein A9Q89_02335 [Gammaproteobacteria bacterium 53_120_T64]|nr:hypothetical protein A9Q89_02335 [Gammaproteobacteria bacterium 53_120_T64]
MSRCKPNSIFSDFDQALKNLFAAQLSLGRETLNLLGLACHSSQNLIDSYCPPVSKHCDIPEPCWMPQKIGEVCCTLRKCDVGEICLLISNEDFVSHDYQIQVPGEHGKLVNINTDSFTLGPKERRMVSLKFAWPKDHQVSDPGCCEKDGYELLIWVVGCNKHYLNWHIEAGESAKPCCYELAVADKPDYTLHWYNHFQAYRPCTTPLNKEG